jgi:FeS assembly SUF system protein
MIENEINDPMMEEVINAIKRVYDPEIPVNIFELGLIYDIKITVENEVVVLMTLTAPNCPEAGSIPSEVEYRIREIEEVKDVKVLLTFDPPWEKEMMSEAAQLELGFF